MQRVAESLTTMGAEQLLLTLVLLASYALALGEFVSFRVRLGAVGIAVLATAGFAALSPSWEAGVILMTLVPVGMGLFAAAAWMLWSLAMWREQPGVCCEGGTGRAGAAAAYQRHQLVTLDRAAALHLIRQTTARPLPRLPELLLARGMHRVQRCTNLRKHHVPRRVDRNVHAAAPRAGAGPMRRRIGTKGRSTAWPTTLRASSAPSPAASPSTSRPRTPCSACCRSSAGAETRGAIRRSTHRSTPQVRAPDALARSLSACPCPCP